jgi:UDP-N-acetylmuramoyl-L-alanyl-D-glutamate--2,6-diaminopimelate ligase
MSNPTKIYKLSEYISLLEKEGLVVETFVPNGAGEKEVEYVSYNSQDAYEGTLFVCKGAHFKEEYLLDALSKGSFAYISEIKYEVKNANVPYILVSDVRKTMAFIADFYYNQAWDKLTLVGITGTKGKSTTTYFMKYIIDDYLASLKKPESAIISSIDTYDGVVSEESHITTPESMTLHKHFDNAVKSGIDFLSMEVSSQALKYDRVVGVKYDVASFLNIGIDHISAIEHPTFDDYLKSKMLIFQHCKAVCINLHTDYLDMVMDAAKVTPKIITFGLVPEADIYGYDVKVTDDGISFKAKCDRFDQEFKLAIPGMFNVDNALAAIAACYVLDIPLVHVYAGLAKAHVSGRMEIFASKEKGVKVIVDYAHNQMSFEALFQSTLTQFPDKKITIVFGCPGYKALGRRKELGDIAGKYSKKVYLTEEDAGEEPVINICEEIATHVKEQGCDYEIILDRGEAIKKSIDEADKDTIILLTGKGRETRQKRGTEYIEVISDVAYVEEFLGLK